jgi:transcriptional regulator with XRE-family HTH domain
VCRLRGLKNYSQETLAEKAGIDRRYVQKIESGSSNPSVNTVAAIRLALGCSWDELLRGLS